MAQQGGQIIWELDVDTSKFDKKMRRASSTAKQVGKEAKGSMSDMSKSITSSFNSAVKASQQFAIGLVAVATGASTLLGFGIKIAADLETSRQGFITLTGSAKEADRILEMIKKDAAKTPFELPGLIKANQLLTAVTKSGDRSEKMLLNVGKALSAMGKGQTELDRIIVNLQQIGAVGKASLIDIKQFAFAGIPIFEMLSQVTGKTGEALGDMISDGQITFELLEKMFNDAGMAGGRFADAFTNQAGTLNQVWSNLKDNIGIAASQIVKDSGVFDIVKNAMKTLTDAIGKNTNLISSYMKTTFQWVIKNLPVITGIILGALTPAFVTLAKTIIMNTKALAPYMVLGALLLPLITEIIKRMGGWEGILKTLGNMFTFVTGKITPFVNIIKTKFERLGQILNTLGIAGDFGGLINTFSKLVTDVTFYTKRAIQIIGEFIQKVKNVLAFGGTEGTASWIQAFEGIYNRIKPLLDALTPLFETIKTQFVLVGQIIQTQIVPQFNALIAVLQPFIQVILPPLIAFMTQLVVGILAIVSALIVLGLAIVTGLVTAVATALPYVMQAFAGLIQFFRGFIQFLTGVFTLNWRLAMEGIMQMAKGAYDFIVNIWTALQKFINGFVKGVMMFFTALAESVGISVSTMANNVVAWIQSMASQFIASIQNLVSKVIADIKNLWSMINAEVSSWPGKLYSWGQNIIKSFADGIRAGVGWVVDAIKSALDTAKRFMEGHSPPIAGPFKEIDKWGYNVGFTYGKFLNRGIDSSVAGLLGESSYSLNATDSDIPTGSTSNQTITINVGEIKDTQDLDMIAREIGYRLALAPGTI